MTKRSFVRIRIDGERFKVDKRDIVKTHFVHKRATVHIPAFSSSTKHFNSEF